MEIIQNITIDLFARDILPEVLVNQGDNAVVIKASLLNGNELFTPAGDVKVYVEKPDGTRIYNACSVEGSLVVVRTTTQMTAVSGRALAVLQMTKGESELKTPVFVMRIAKTIVDDGALESTDEFTALESALQDVEKIKEEGVIKGDPGAAATIKIGSVSTGEPGTEASVTNSGTENAAVLDFVIPQGEQGAQGLPGTLDTDGIVEYQEPEVYTAPVSGISLKTWLGRAAKGLADLFDGLAEKLDKSSALKTYNEVMAATEEGFYPDALAVKTGFTQLNTNLAATNSNVSTVSSKVARFHSGSFIQTPDSNGYVSLDISKFGLSITPNTVIGMLQNLEGFIRYDFDGSSKTILKLKILGKDGSVITSNVRFCVFMIEGANIW